MDQAGAEPSVALPDHALAVALLAGHPGASDAAVERFAPLVRRLLQRFFGQQVEVEDTLQDVFLRVFLRLPTLRDPKALRGFVIAITIRIAGRQARRLRAWQWRAMSAVDTVENHLSEVDVTAQHAILRLNEVLLRVRECDRTAFVLRYIEGMRLEEIAQRVGSSSATVRRRLRRASARVSYLASNDVFLTEYTATRSSPARKHS